MSTITAKTTQEELGSLSEVLERHLPMVQRIAYRASSSFGLPTGMDAEDLVSHGVLGLADAYNRFDPERGVQFEAYAALRVKGTIVDAIRQVDWVPRKVRAHAKLVNETKSSLTAKLGRTPTPTEMGQALGTPEKGRRRPPATLVALEGSSTSTSEDAMNILETLADQSVEQPGVALEEAEMRAALPVAMETLAERDRLVLTLYYFEGVPLTKIAQMLGVTESRVSQLHMRALQGLRNQLDVS
ncbi:MAG TPA: FliA/WhiG family RNA polymerase sigma factor [Actinomycetota bacterium]|nr:FliA/WhiG family RNA polymerase sigma factor [Actinomycetota bacterium]